MKASDFLRWGIKEGITLQHVGIIDVPDEYDEFTPQTEEWWRNAFSGCPPHPIAEGTYLYIYQSQIEDAIELEGKIISPDAEVETYDDLISLYYLED